MLTFQKKGYTTRRITSTATRALTEADKQEDIRAQADKPGDAPDAKNSGENMGK